MSKRTTFQNLVGEAYMSCRFETFDVSNPNGAAKRAAVEWCQKIAADVETVVSRGQSIVLMGPVGTGKDHLLACMLRPVVKAGIACRRVNGVDLAGHCRDLIGGHSTERDFLDQWAAFPLLALSDPDGTKDKVSDYYGEWLFRIIDARYRAGKSAWITINAKDDGAAQKQLGARAWDRIQHRAVVIHTDWPSHRKPAMRVNAESRP